MLLIIDTNILHKVFNSKDPDYPVYKSVNKCITVCKGIMVYGGSTFLKEYECFLRDMRIRNRRLFIELNKKGKLKQLPKEEVDRLEKKLYTLERKNKNKFNDAHLIACAIIGQSKLICTDDSKADRYIRDLKFYPKSTMRPSIYRNNNHTNLLHNCWH